MLRDFYRLFYFVIRYFVNESNFIIPYSSILWTNITLNYVTLAHNM